MSVKGYHSICISYAVFASTFQKCVDSLICLFGVLRCFQHCTGHMTGSWKGRGNQYIEFARVLYCKLPTNGKQLPAFPHKALTGIELRGGRRECYHSATVAPVDSLKPFRHENSPSTCMSVWCHLSLYILLTNC